MLDGAGRAENNQGEPIKGGFRRSVSSVSRYLTRSGKSENPAGGNSRGKKHMPLLCSFTSDLSRGFTVGRRKRKRR